MQKSILVNSSINRLDSVGRRSENSSCRDVYNEKGGDMQLLSSEKHTAGMKLAIQWSKWPKAEWSLTVSVRH